LLAFGSPFAAAEQARDAGQFLDLSIESAELQPDNYERYRVVSRGAGRVYLHVTSEVGFQEAIAFQQFSNILGVRTHPRWPTLLRRGADGILSPMMAQLKGFKYQSDQDWVPAIVMADLSSAARRNEGRIQPLTAHQMAQLTEFAFLGYILDAKGMGETVVTPDEVVNNAAGFFFDRDRRSKIKSFRDWDKEDEYRSDKRIFPKEQLRALKSDPNALNQYLDEVGAFLDRLESTVNAKSDSGRPLLESIFDISIEVGPSSGDRKAIFEQLRRRIQQLRGEMQSSFRAILGDSSIVIPKKPFALDAYTPDLSQYRLREVPKGNPFENGWKYHSKDLLWQYAMSSSDMRKRLLNEWQEPAALSFQQEFQGDSAKSLPLDKVIEKFKAHEPLSQAILASREMDRRMFLVGPERYRVGRAKPVDKNFLWYLNQNLPKMLIVVSRNDLEGEAIYRLAKRIQRDYPDRIELYEDLPEYRPGQALHRRDADKIIAEAKRRKVRDVIICELGAFEVPLPPLFQEAGVALHRIDHHNEKETKFSSLEQFAQIFGYQLELPELITAAFDRSGLLGLRDLGFSADEMHDYLAHGGQYRRIRPFLNAIDKQIAHPQDGAYPQNTLFRAEIPAGPLSRYTQPFAYLYYPQMPDVILEGPDRVRFCGSYEQCKVLRAALQGVIEGEWVRGGDMQTGFIGVRPTYARPSAVAQRFENVLTAAHDYDCIKAVTLINVVPGNGR
jgi:hypothetical protein